MKTKQIEIVFITGPGSHCNNGAIKRRIGLRINDEDKDVVMLRLDSAQGRERQAERWAKEFKLDQAELSAKLRIAAVTATAESQHPEHLECVRTAEFPPVPPRTLDEVRPVFNKRLAELDDEQLDVVFGSIMAHRLDGDPVWLFVVGAPGDSKTETLRATSQHPDIFMISTLTPAALISGYETEGEDPSLLPKLDGKVLLIKDFTSVLEMSIEARSELLGTLRDAYDGEAGKTFGTGETKRYKSRFGLVAAVTPAIDNYWAVGQQLGERFLRFRLRGQGRGEKVRRAMKNANDETVMRTELSAAAQGVLAQKPNVPHVSEQIEEKLIALADFVSLARSAVARDRGGVVQYVPLPEVGTRVGKALKKLGMGIAMARGLGELSEDVYAIVRRVGLDSIPSMRARLIEVLWRLRANSEKTSTIADEAEVATGTAKTWLDDLRLLGIVDRGGKANSGYTWTLRGEFQVLIEQATLWERDCVIDGGGDSAPATETLDSYEVTLSGPEVVRPLRSADDVGGTESPPPPTPSLIVDALDKRVVDYYRENCG